VGQDELVSPDVEDVDAAGFSDFLESAIVVLVALAVELPPFS